MLERVWYDELPYRTASLLVCRCVQAGRGCLRSAVYAKGPKLPYSLPHGCHAMRCRALIRHSFPAAVRRLVVVPVRDPHPQLQRDRSRLGPGRLHRRLRRGVPRWVLQRKPLATSRSERGCSISLPLAAKVAQSKPALRTTRCHSRGLCEQPAAARGSGRIPVRWRCRGCNGEHTAYLVHLTHTCTLIHTPPRWQDMLAVPQRLQKPVAPSQHPQLDTQPMLRAGGGMTWWCRGCYQQGYQPLKDATSLSVALKDMYNPGNTPPLKVCMTVTIGGKKQQGERKRERTGNTPCDGAQACPQTTSSPQHAAPYDKLERPAQRPPLQIMIAQQENDLYCPGEVRIGGSGCMSPWCGGYVTDSLKETQTAAVPAGTALLTALDRPKEGIRPCVSGCCASAWHSSMPCLLTSGVRPPPYGACRNKGPPQRRGTTAVRAVAPGAVRYASMTARRSHRITCYQRRQHSACLPPRSLDRPT